MSRLSQARAAVRPSLPARALLSGPPGAGKTRTALIVGELLAEGGKVLVIDTEKESALTYADDFTFTHLPWLPPFEPRELGKTIVDAGKEYDVVIVDSLSHFWRGAGGTLDIAAGKFTGWKAARPAQDDLVEAILGCRAHFIGCARSKIEHVQEEENGKHVVRKLGMSVIQDDDLEYELNVAVELDMTHTLTVSKSRTIAVPVGRTFTAGHAEDFAVLYRDWLKGGEPPAAGKTVNGLVARMNDLPERERRECKAQFLAQLGRPEHLRESQVRDAGIMVAAFEAQAAESSTSDGSGHGEAGDLAPAPVLAHAEGDTECPVSPEVAPDEDAA